MQISKHNANIRAEKLMLSPLNLTGDLASFDVGQGIQKGSKYDELGSSRLGCFGRWTSRWRNELLFLRPHYWRMGLESLVLIICHQCPIRCVCCFIIDKFCNSMQFEDFISSSNLNSPMAGRRT
jgi:hypothetical protein